MRRNEKNEILNMNNSDARCDKEAPLENLISNCGAQFA